MRAKKLPTPLGLFRMLKNMEVSSFKFDYLARTNVGGGIQSLE